jgi:hypothetical protein
MQRLCYGFAKGSPRSSFRARLFTLPLDKRLANPKSPAQYRGRWAVDLKSRTAREGCGETIGGRHIAVDPRVTELHCIMPIGNLVSVMKQGILAHAHAAKLKHHSVALQPVQDKRDKKQVPGGLKLHQYANLYFHARNPMMFKRRDHASDLCVLRVSHIVACEIGTVTSPYGDIGSKCPLSGAPAVAGARLRRHLCDGLAAPGQPGCLLPAQLPEVR